jgi:hypothetical protein
MLSALFLLGIRSQGQEIIPLDTAHWSISGRASYLFENYRGSNSLYMKGGSITLKDTKFVNGTIEFDIFLKEEQAFPGVVFRIAGNNAEQFFLRPHLSGKPDANQAAPLTNGITPWQLYFGQRYSFPYVYKYDDWTHVKIVVNEDKAQVYLDYSKEPHLSWNLFHVAVEGELTIQGGRSSGMHLANIRIDKTAIGMVDFKPIERKPI